MIRPSSTPVANPQSTTEYTLIITDPAVHPNCDRTSSDKVTVTIDPCIEPPFEVKFYPNPTDGNSTLFISGLNEGETLTFELWNMLGQRVIEGWNFGAGTHNILLNKIESGMYFYRVWRGDQVVVKEKVLVQK